MPAAPYTYASALTQIALGRESQPGQAVPPTVLLPVEKPDLSDDIAKIEDKALRGSMVDVYNIVPGPIHSVQSFDGPVLADSFPYLINNLLGDTYYTGTPTGTGATQLAAAVTAASGGNPAQTQASIPAGTVVQVDTGPASEIRTVQTVTGAAAPYTVTFTTPLSGLHANNTPVVPVQAPYTAVQSLLNSGGTGGQAQPPTLTVVDQNWVTANTGARAYPGVCLEEITVKADPGGLFTYTAKAQGFPSAPAAAGLGGLAASGVLPNAGWRATTAIAGTSLNNVDAFEITLKRALEVIFCVDGTQAPLTIRRGPVTITGKIHLIAADESALLTYLAQNNVPLSLAMDNGVAGAGQQHTQFDIAAARYISPTKIDRGKEAVGFDVAFQSLPAASLAGVSGGQSPVKVTSINAVAPNSY